MKKDIHKFSPSQLWVINRLGTDCDLIDVESGYRLVDRNGGFTMKVHPRTMRVLLDLGMIKKDITYELTEGGKRVCDLIPKYTKQ